MESKVLKMAKHFLFAIILHGAFALTVLVHSQDQLGFISIDCGIPDGSSYKDGITDIYYTSDSSFTETGANGNILPQYRSNNPEQQLWTVRSFPEGAKNCYTLRPSPGKDRNYLIRASFMYGNYDGKGQTPTFDLYLGVNRWDTVAVSDASSTISKEIIHLSSSEDIYVCLVNTGYGTPFISVLELRPLPNNTYIPKSGSLELFDRANCGLVNQTYRYKDDVIDRIWSPFGTSLWRNISTIQTVDSSYNSFQLPSVVMSTAVTPLTTNDSIGLYWSPDNATSQYYFYMHFAEIEKLQANQSREFNIFLNGKSWYKALSPSYLVATTIFSPTYRTKPDNETYFQIWINKTETSTLPPLLNAIEIYTVNQLLQAQTDQKDVDSIKNIKSMYRIKRNWQGDPCAPRDYSWDGLNCSYSNFDPPGIISLNLSSSGLTGKIAPFISNLTMMQYLDLSNNSLNGTVPIFLSQLQLLRVLNLQNNNLSGSIPMELIEKSNKGSLLLSVGGNPNLASNGGNPNPCVLSPCQKKKNIVIPAAAAIVGLVILLLCGLALLWHLKRRKKDVPASNEQGGVLESKKQKFTYSEVLNITKNFASVTGKGGFGTVYHGYLDGFQVAVKMLSPSSVQGYNEFLAEANFLTRVHHKNITSFVGYCHENTNMGLVYEYMANGNLALHLSDKNASFLSWETRLRIAMDSAQGLEYLHNGCKPPIIHRDVKSTNILLDENFQAKLADLGLSRVFPGEGGTHVSTKVVGTPGYLDPEYYASNWLNEKSDVFSFGVVLLEIITGRPAISINPEKVHLIKWVSSMVERGDVKNIVDPRLDGDPDINSVWKAIEVAMICVSPTSIERPTMTYVVMELKQCLAMELARGHEGFETDSNQISGINYVHTGQTPLAR
ncbi:probable LRR receptor-like serine/threonine-protein kinase At1g05700 isoform X2 [Quercus robur]|uniref:probable LRR receptor-like serine/threonine-protein kinase At1g05700 isoform X2 n=1 Tax=Quercus robur TaxID=38942 RepID=UPI0021632FDF|nr:probable LRR receptor-like serine/threonine-protein kinase At1g05700 isoform X2 [Quercus robur]